MEINIAMIGASGSGKTSFMSGLYHHFVHRCQENDGFGLSPIEYQGDGDKFAAVAAFSQLASIIFNRKFPPGTVGSSSYKFKFFKESADICKINWMDYRGGAIEEAAFMLSDGRSSDFTGINRAIDQSHAVAIFIDALQLTEYENDSEVRRHSGIDAVNNALMALDLIYEGNKQKVLIFILTKCDGSSILDEWKANNFQNLIGRAVALLEPAIRVANRNKWRCGIVATGVAGQANVKTNSFFVQSRIGFENVIVNDPKPFGQNDALFYLLGSVLAGACKDEAATRISALRYEADKVLSERSKIRDAWRILRGAAAADQIAQQKISAAEEVEKAALLRHEFFINEMVTKSLKNVKKLTPW